MRQAAVTVWEDITGEKRLVAYAVPHPEFAPARARAAPLPQGEAARLHGAYYLGDAQGTAADTQRQDRPARFQPAPDTERPELEATAGAPQDTLELQLTQIWQEVLGIRPVGVKDNFFELGGHTLLAVRLFSKIREVFGKELPLPAIFQAPTVEELAEVLRQQGFSAPEESRFAAVTGRQ